MTDAECPYCGAYFVPEEVEEEEMEYECPKCDKTMLIYGELDITYYTEKTKLEGKK